MLRHAVHAIRIYGASTLGLAAGRLFAASAKSVEGATVTGLFGHHKLRSHTDWQTITSDAVNEYVTC
jgi:hypothetical protein